MDGLGHVSVNLRGIEAGRVCKFRWLPSLEPGVFLDKGCVSGMTGGLLVPPILLHCQLN